MAKTGLFESQSPVVELTHPSESTCNRRHLLRHTLFMCGATSEDVTMPSEGIQGDEWGA